MTFEHFIHENKDILVDCDYRNECDYQFRNMLSKKGHLIRNCSRFTQRATMINGTIIQFAPLKTKPEMLKGRRDYKLIGMYTFERLVDGLGE